MRRCSHLMMSSSSSWQAGRISCECRRLCGRRSSALLLLSALHLANSSSSETEDSIEDMELNGALQAPPVERAAAESPAGEEASHEGKGEAADTQLDIPQALQDLLCRLKGSLRPGVPPVTQLGEIHLQDEEFGDFFYQDGRHCSTRTSEVRLKVLQAIGSCKTLKIFNHVKQLQEGKLSATELKALLIPLQTSAQLEEIEISSSPFKKEDACIGPRLPKLIRSSHGLRRLILSGCPFAGLRANLAAEVASALRPRVHHGWEELHFRYLAGPDTSNDTVMHVAETISCAPKLQKLQLDQFRLRDLQLHQDAREALVTALKGVPQLQEPRTGWFDGEMIDLLAEVYNGTSSNTVLNHLSLGFVFGARAEALTALVSGNITSIELDGRNLSERFVHDFSSDHWRNLGTCILHAPRLRTLTLHVTSIDRDLNVENVLVQLSDACQESTRLRVTLSHQGPLLHPQFLFLQRALSYCCLKSKSLEGLDVGTLDFQSFAEKLGSNSSVERLGLPSCTSSSMDGWTKLFGHLRCNSSISVLGLDKCEDLNENNSRDLMDLLQVNFILEVVTIERTAWERDGKGALIQEALDRNKKLWGYFSVLEQAKLPFHVARAGRVFLCGDPFAGKTMLKVTMMKTKMRESKSESVLGKAVGKVKSMLGRTKGIEVELLCEDVEATISVWDLAGQEVFRALQNILFPRSSQACMFVLTFNPFQSDCHGNSGVLKHNLQEAFRGELRSWLRFIVSSTLSTGHFRPQVVVIITQRDCHKDPGEIDLITRGFIEIVKALREKFHDVVDLCPKTAGYGVITDNGDFLFHVNATIKAEVEPITKSVICSRKNLLRGRSSKVPKVCSDLASHFMSPSKKVKHSNSPLWKSAEFYDFCSTWHSLLQEFSGYRTDDAKMRVLHAVASYMHDVGAVCLTPTALLPHTGTDAFDIDSPAKLMVVQPNWSSQNLLGELISSESLGGKHRPQRALSTDGFIDPPRLYNLIRDVLQQQKKTNLKVEVGMVKDLLIELDLCHEIKGEDGVTKYFMPIILHEMEDNRSEGKKMNKLRVEGQISWRIRRAYGKIEVFWIPSTMSGPRENFTRCSILS